MFSLFSSIFLFLSFCFSSRIFKLKHPTKDLYLGGKNSAPDYGKALDAQTFQDEEADLTGFVRIVLKSDAPKKVWNINRENDSLFFGSSVDDKAEAFKIKHLKRDKVTIKSAVDNKCLQYDWDVKRFKVQKCLKGKNPKEQTFQITDEEGKPTAKKVKNEDIEKLDKQIVPGIHCPGCVWGGFGSVWQYALPDAQIRSNIPAKSPAKSTCPFMAGSQPCCSACI